MIKESVLNYANASGLDFDSIKRWPSKSFLKGCEIYLVEEKGPIAFTGYPVFVIVEPNEQLRFATGAETLKIIGVQTL